MAAQQKRMLTAEKSKLGKMELPDLVDMLQQDSAWSTLPLETRQHLYSLIPLPKPEDPPNDVDVNPLNTPYLPYIEAELGRWQQNLVDGQETKVWRENALQAGRERMEGKYDQWKAAEREETWGQPGKADAEDENTKPKAEGEDEGARSSNLDADSHESGADEDVRSSLLGSKRKDDGADDEAPSKKRRLREGARSNGANSITHGLDSLDDEAVVGRGAEAAEAPKQVEESEHEGSVADDGVRSSGANSDTHGLDSADQEETVVGRQAEEAKARKEITETEHEGSGADDGVSSSDLSSPPSESDEASRLLDDDDAEEPGAPAGVKDSDDDGSVMEVSRTRSK